MKKETIPFRTGYSPQVHVTFTTTGDSLTKQSFKAECDVIIYLKTITKRA